jgi:hypothetical protein
LTRMEGDDASSSSSEDLSDGFEFEEDEDDVRQRELMGGAAAVSLQESEQRARKRAREAAGLALPMREAPLRPMPPNTMPQLRERVASCALCKECLCRSARRLDDVALAKAAEYGRDADFALHFGSHRSAAQLLALAGLLHERLCPDSLRGLPWDLVLHLMECVGMTLRCEKTQMRVQSQLQRDSELARIAPCSTRIFDVSSA